MNRVLRLGSGIVTIAGLCAFSWQAARVTYADWLTRRATAESLRRAVARTPENAHAHLTFALLVQDAEPAAAKAHFEQAVRHNPWDSRSLVELGLLAENTGDYGDAERLLLEAARVDLL